MKKNKQLSIIIPTLNEAQTLPLLLADIKLCPYQFEIIIVDAGSSDSTTLIGRIAEAKVINSNQANRGYQLQKGASVSKQDWILFLHADCRLNRDWATKVIHIINNQSNAKYAWFFDFKISNKGIMWILLELAVSIRSYFFQKPYGDQGLLIHKSLYSLVGGYKRIEIMEDLDLIIRLNKQTELKRIGTWIKTSSRKYIKGNIIKTAIKNAILRSRWRKGEDPKELAQKYYSTK